MLISAAFSKSVTSGSRNNCIALRIHAIAHRYFCLLLIISLPVEKRNSGSPEFNQSSLEVLGVFMFIYLFLS